MQEIILADANDTDNLDRAYICKPYFLSAKLGGISLPEQKCDTATSKRDIIILHNI
jgi:hypothetical protein